MKKNLLFTLALLCAIVQGSWGQTMVRSENELAQTVKATGANIVMSNDIELSMPITIQGDGSAPVSVTITMNGKKLSYKQAVGQSSASCVFIVPAGSVLNLIGDPKGGSNYGIIENVINTSGYKKNNDGVDPSTVFISDKDELFDVVLSGDEASLIVQGTVIVDNFADLREAVKFDGANIQLAADINSNDIIAIENNRTVTIDLNGKTLNRGLTSLASGHGQVVVVAEGSTLKLSNGTLTGGFGGDGGGLENKGTASLTNVNITGNHANDRGAGISNKGTFTMTGGSITNNVSNDNDATSGGGAIYTYSGSNTTLTGVTITGNQAKVAGGGAINNLGILTIDGCTITGNSSKNGGAIWTAGGSTLNMQGKNTVTDNTVNGNNNNIYQSKDVVITVTGSLEGSQIGITMNTPGVFTSGYSNKNPDLAPKNCFVSDVEDCKLDLEDGEAKLEKGQSDGIDNVKAGGKNYDDNTWYDLQGRKLNAKPTTKGVYINEGRKVLIP